ncbi:MAG TPA: RodZ domain-containing protein [Verrucomicrobiae bacterium]|nr:RodZ domain-containing protein [Verrucomicrobiae bacterium]
MGEFGDKFRKEREKKGISLDDVSNATKIGSRMLKAIEEEHFDQLPGGVFNKGFIRAYAKHLGLNDEEAIGQYLALMRQAQINAQAAWEPPSRTSSSAQHESNAISPAKSAAAKNDSNRASSKAPPAAPAEELPDLQLPRAEHVRHRRRDYIDRGDRGIPWRIVAVSILVIVLAIMLWHRHTHNKRTLAEAGAPAINAAPSLFSEQPVPVTRPLELASSTTKTQLQASHEPSASHPLAAGQQLTPSASRTAATRVNATSAPKTTPLSLVIRASENSWISVTVGGQLLKQETLIAPAETSILASGDVTVKVGNAAGVSFLLNGKDIPPQGTEAEVKTLVFDSSGLKEPAADAGPTVN